MRNDYRIFHFSLKAFRRACVFSLNKRYSSDSGLKGRWCKASLMGRHSSINALASSLKHHSTSRSQM